jgi:hypothetical protein
MRNFSQKPASQQANNDRLVCESGIKSANTTNYIQRPALEENTSNSGCESAINSWRRRDFVKKAVIGTAAVGIGGLLLGKNVVPQSSAFNCSIESSRSIVVDNSDGNEGTIFTCKTLSLLSNVLSFGKIRCFCAATCVGVVSGEAIGSNRVCTVPNFHGLDFYTNYHKRMSITNGGTVILDVGSLNSGTLCPGPSLEFGLIGSGEGIASARTSGAPNLNGLDFYTDYLKRVSITNGGSVGIGTVTPSSALDVAGTIRAHCGSLVDVAGTNKGSLKPGIQFGVPCSGEGIASNRTCSSAGNLQGVDLYTNFTRRLSVTNKGMVGIGTVTPSSTLDVNGNHHVSGSLSIGSNNAATGPDIYVGVAKCGLALTCNNSVFVANNSGCSTNQFRVDAFQNVLSVIAHSSPGAKSGAALSFRTALAGGGEINRVFITPGGDVGVNTCSPVTTLDVNGTIHTPKIGVGITVPATPLQVNGTASVSNLGVGTTAPKTTLQVNGSIAAKILPKSASYSMVASDFGILASGTGTTITLPAAKTAAGMLVFIKNVNTTSIAVTVKPSGTDKIDGSAASQSLGSANSRLTLVSDGVSNWYIIASS